MPEEQPPQADILSLRDHHGGGQMEHETRLWMLLRQHPNESKDRVTSVLRAEEDGQMARKKMLLAGHTARRDSKNNWGFRKRKK